MVASELMHQNDKLSINKPRPCKWSWLFLSCCTLSALVVIYVVVHKNQGQKSFHQILTKLLARPDTQSYTLATPADPKAYTLNNRSTQGWHLLGLCTIQQWQLGMSRHKNNGLKGPALLLHSITFTLLVLKLIFAAWHHFYIQSEVSTLSVVVLTKSW